jgi:8-oxo-dGTP pyrophosphatase MutT (NUDIX family)
LSGRPIDRLWRASLRVAYPLQLAWWRVRHPTLTGAAVAVWHEERILLIRNSYRSTLGFPAGGVKRSESPRAAAARELREEVGIGVSPAALDYLGVFLEVTKYADDNLHLFELRCEHPPEVRVDGREVVWAEFLPPREALERGVVGTVRNYLRERA